MLTTKMHGLTHFLLDLLPTHGFSNGEKNLKKISQPSFRNGGSFLELLKIFFVLKFANLLTTSKLIVIYFSLLEIVIHSLFVLNLESLGFFCKTRENSNFLKKGKMVILVKIQNFSISRMMKRTSPLESSCKI